jgi:hypothetical protein
VQDLRLRHFDPMDASKVRRSQCDTVELSANAPSFIDVPLAAPGTFRASNTDWGPSS